MVGIFHIWKVKIFVMIFFKGVTEYSDRKVIILPRYSNPCLPLSNAVVVCCGRVHCRIQSWIPGSVLFRLTARCLPDTRQGDPCCTCTNLGLP